MVSTVATFSPSNEYYWEDRLSYYAALDAVRQTLEKVWLRVQALEVKSPGKLVFRHNQERLLQLLRDHDRMTPAQIWEAM